MSARRPVPGPGAENPAQRPGWPLPQPGSDELADAAADPAAVVEGPGYRITALTSRLLRLERSETGSFVDAATQVVQRRRFPVPDMAVERDGEALQLWTEHLHLRYDGGPFTAAGLSVTLRTRAQESHRTTWRHGDPQDPVDPGSPSGGNLGGTARTLDEADGEVPLEPGLLSRTGYAVVDDSASLLMTADAWVASRPGPGEDLYLFGHGRDHRAALRDWFALTGPSPLPPRWALGSWWSRYHRYTAEEYVDLVDRFRAEGLPFSVAVLDMDWHLVDVDPALGSGWTGYTWDTELVPDPAALLRDLHERGLRVTLNVHPADGVRRHEEAYADVARDLGLDPATGREIAFDISSREFTAAYLRRLHHPHEEIGVDFWWLDWQSGTASPMPGLDPLWMLNHVHFLDSGRGGRRPLTFSRYAGPGSHRYPVGFSGDTVISWDSLAFQPAFTAAAANIGFFWWSHDVGGHLRGTKDDELAARWVQLGALSPVNRLHSTSTPFAAKEPWRYGPRARAVMARWLRLRAELVPYLYTAAWASHVEGVAPVRPVHHDHPGSREAYRVPHEFFLGPDLLVAPITSPADADSALGAATAWLPEGTWWDLLSGRRYRAGQDGRTVVLHRPLEEAPVLVRAGAVIPLAGDPMADAGCNPEELVLRVAPGADGGCVLVEDDGRGAPTVEDQQRTRVSVRWSSAAAASDGPGGALGASGGGSGGGPEVGEAVLRVEPPEGPGVLTRRRLVVQLLGVVSAEGVVARAGGRDVPVRAQEGASRGVLALDLRTVDLREGLEVVVSGARLRGPRVPEDALAVLEAAQTSIAVKDRVAESLARLSGVALLAELDALDVPPALRSALVEIVAADG